MTTQKTAPRRGKRWNPDDDQYMLGMFGEASTAGWYEELGYEILHVRYKCKEGELDVIAQGPDGTIAFVEVKTRRGTQFGAAEAVTARKLSRMRKAAARWLADKPYARVRFDVVEVIFDGRNFTSRMYQGVDDGAC